LFRELAEGKAKSGLPEKVDRIQNLYTCEQGVSPLLEQLSGNAGMPAMTTLYRTRESFRFKPIPGGVASSKISDQWIHPLAASAAKPLLTSIDFPTFSGPSSLDSAAEVPSISESARSCR
jgi:hypothetical protein